MAQYKMERWLSGLRQHPARGCYAVSEVRILPLSANKAACESATCAQVGEDTAELANFQGTKSLELRGLAHEAYDAFLDVETMVALAAAPKGACVQW